MKARTSSYSGASTSKIICRLTAESASLKSCTRRASSSEPCFSSFEAMKRKKLAAAKLRCLVIWSANSSYRSLASSSMRTARSRASLSGSVAKSIPLMPITSPLVLHEHVEDALTRQGALGELLLPLLHQRVHDLRRLRVAVEHAGVQLGAVGARQVQGREQILGIVPEARQRLHLRLLRLHLLIFLAVGHAGRLHVDERKPGIADGLFDHRGEPRHVRG